MKEYGVLKVIPTPKALLKGPMATVHGVAECDGLRA